jgi:hypothetical protein
MTVTIVLGVLLAARPALSWLQAQRKVAPAARVPS